MEKRGFIFVLFLAICISGVVSHARKDLVIQNSLDQLFQLGEKVPPVFKKLSDDLDLPGVVRGTEDYSQWPEQQNIVFCTLCTQLMNQALAILASPNVTTEEFFDRVTEICIDLGLGNEIFCDGFISQAEPEIVYILMNTPDTDGNDICGMFFVGFGCESRKDYRIWNVTLPDTIKPPVDLTPYPQLTEDLPTLKFLHLADIHYDPDYEHGSNAECDEIYLCCQSLSTGDRVPGDEAGFWGDYRVCDIPRWTVEALLEDAAINHPDIDFIFWTGDHIAHNVWTNSKELNLQLFEDTFDMIQTYFPNTMVLPGIGNHEGHPVNTFAQPYVAEEEFDISWLYDEMARMWQRWLPDVGGTVAYGGYYAITIRPGLRVISINSNYCYGFNWWLIMDSKDVAENLIYLANQLQDAEDAGDYAYILAHMSPGNSECQYSWSHQFNRIISRYENTVSGIFHGHTHNDHFEVYFDPDDPNRPYELSFVVASMTTYVGLNPGYDIHVAEGDFEGSQHRILNKESYMFDLEEANKDIINKPVVVQTYSFIDAYGLPDMSPQSLATMVTDMNVENSTLFDEFFRNYHRHGVNVDNGCGAVCKENMLCGLYISDNSDHTKCESLQE